MNEDEKKLTHTLEDIKQMMERSSRFISLSGLSGIAAGFCALAGAWMANGIIDKTPSEAKQLRQDVEYPYVNNFSIKDYMGNSLFQIAMATFFSALLLAFIFTYLRSKKTKTPLWGTTAMRLLWNMGLPLGIGGVYLLKLIENGVYGYIAPGCLIFYGLALLNASKYTLGEIKYLAYGQLILGLISLFAIGNGLYFWAMGFGVLHIIYGSVMWWKYERTNTQND